MNEREIVTVKSFAFNNKAGGTGLSDWEFNERFPGKAQVRITKKWHDYETGYRFIAKPVSAELVEYLKRNSNTPGVVYVGQFDIV